MTADNLEFVKAPTFHINKLKTAGEVAFYKLIRLSIYPSVWIQLSLLMSNTFKHKQVSSCSCKTIISHVSLCVIDYKTQTGLAVAHALRSNRETDFSVSQHKKKDTSCQRARCSVPMQQCFLVSRQPVLSSETLFLECWELGWSLRHLLTN